MVDAHVSFEIARLLKEKGFDGKWTDIYVENPDSTNRAIYPKITHQMAMAWLREEHNIFIEVRVYQYTFEGKYCYEFDIFHCGSRIIIREEVNRKFYSYEQLIETALKYCLTDLI